MAARKHVECKRCGSGDGFLYAGLALCSACRSVLTHEEMILWT
jgi:hypothetical protein